MAISTKIEWCDHTFNPWIGCTKVSPACDNCYAEMLMDTRYGRAQWGAGNPRSRTSASNWKQPATWHRKAVRADARPFVFCASLADVFDNEVPPEWRADLFRLIDQTPALVWLLLTKRIGNVTKMTREATGGLTLPANVAIGATFGSQNEYERDIAKLSDVRRTMSPLFTFGSFEPLLSSLMLDDRAPDWVIVGGESGAGCRPMDLNWARSLRDQCREIGRVFNFKQTGGHGSIANRHDLDGVTYFDRPNVPALADGSRLAA